MRALSTRSFIRLKERSSVLLPQPDGPMRAVIRLRGTLSDTLRTARKLP